MTATDLEARIDLARGNLEIDLVAAAMLISIANTFAQCHRDDDLAGAVASIVQRMERVVWCARELEAVRAEAATAAQERAA